MKDIKEAIEAMEKSLAFLKNTSGYGDMPKAKPEQGYEDEVDPQNSEKKKMFVTMMKKGMNETP